MKSIGKRRGMVCLAAGLWLLFMVMNANGQILPPRQNSEPQFTLPPTQNSETQFTLPPTPVEIPSIRPLPINLPTAFQLAGVKSLDIALASQRLEIASAQLDRANVLWLPSLFIGTDYARHDGRIQTIEGNIIDTSRQSLMAGVGPRAVFALSEAIYAPLAARQIRRARQWVVQAMQIDTFLEVATAYFNVQQARGEAMGSADAVRRMEDLVRRVEKLAEGLVPQVEVNRARTELARRRQAVESAFDRWQVASTDLTRILRLDSAAAIVPLESPHLRIDLVDLAEPVEDLIAMGLTNRPELTTRQALVQATLAKLRQEKVRPFIPSLLLRGNATNPADPLSSGLFGGGLNNNLDNFGMRNSIDMQVVWEFQNLGFGNRAAIRERKAENELAVLELFRLQDRIAAEIAQAHAQAYRAGNRLKLAEEGLKNAQVTVEKNLEGISQTRRVGEILVLVFRPQEVVAAIQSLDQAYRDYYGAVADINRAQFRLYRAIGQPAQSLLNHPQLASPGVLENPSSPSATNRPQIVPAYSPIPQPNQSRAILLPPQPVYNP